MIAILDALGAASYSDKEIRTFLESRQNVLSLVEEKIAIFRIETHDHTGDFKEC
jgi:hypothetical protein